MQVHLVLRLSTDAPKDAYLDSSLCDYNEGDEDDLSDTDPEDEWGWEEQTIWQLFVSTRTFLFKFESGSLLSF